jgi:hypothetical protein
MSTWQPLPGRHSILKPKSPDNAIMQTPLIDFPFSIAERSTRGLIVAGALSLVLLAVFLRIKLG